ncbi:MAG: ribonuclease D [Flavobacteriales bacterium]|nr:ribonuclease D [Flavobacteriales bacterium]
MTASRPIADQDAFEAALKELSKGPVVALDTEASSFHRYKERICLIQLSDKEHTFLLDPFSIADPAPLGAFLADTRSETVIHDADYDLRLIRRTYGFRVHSVFDTLIAAELLNEPELSLAALLGKYLDIQLDKRFQKADWSKRPLPKEMLDYAAMDTMHLIALRDLLADQLKARERWEWAREEFALLTELPFRDEGPTEPGFLRLKGAKALKPEQLAILHELHAWREGVAEKADRAPFMIVGNDVLVALSKEPPKDIKQLALVKGIGARTLERHGSAIMKAIQRGQRTPKDKWPRVPRPLRHDRDPEYDERLKRLKQRRDALASEWDLRQGIVCPNHLLATIARERPADLDALQRIDDMRNWQARTFGEALLAVL